MNLEEAKQSATKFPAGFSASVPPEVRVQAEQVKKTLPEHFIQKNPLTDSAGIAWQGRDYHESHFPDDRGEIIPQVEQALADYVAGKDPLLENLVAQLAGSRVLIPIQAVAIETATTESGLKADNASEMAMVKLQLNQTETALPIFSSATALAEWNPKARPVPMLIEQAAQSAVLEGCTTLLLDLNRAQPIKLSRSILWALGKGEKWVHPAKDQLVLGEIQKIVEHFPQIEKAALRPGDSRELAVHLKLSPGLAAAQVRELIDGFNQYLSYSEVVAEKVSSISLKLHQ